MRKSLLAVGLSALTIAVVFALSARSTDAGTQRKPAAAPAGIHKIKHVIVIMQENRSFDEYFGTFPGADGLPRNAAGKFATCVPDPDNGGCVRPYHDPASVNFGGPHGYYDARKDINGGRMNGFVARAENAAHNCSDPNAPECVVPGAGRDVMGFKDDRDIPNYWTWAENYTLLDHM